MAPGKTEIKREMLSKCQLVISDFRNIPIANVKKLVSNFFDNEKYMLHYENLHLYSRLGLKLKKVHRVLEFNHSQWLKPYLEFSAKNNRCRKKVVTRMENRCTN